MKFTLIITYQGCDMFESTKIKKVLRLRSLVRVATIVISVCEVLLIPFSTAFIVTVTSVTP